MVYCNRTPQQHAAFLNFAAALEFDLPQTNIQAAFDHFYSVTLSLLNQFYPEKTITVSSRDPDYITPVIKAKLRCKNKLMHARCVEEASALAKLIGKDSRKLNRIQGTADSKELWSAVRHITGRTRQVHNISGIDADSLNSHYANVSTDPNYTPPSLKLTTVSDDQDYISEWSIFKVLDTLRPSATVLDRIPAWFLRLGAAVFCKALAYLFNQSIASSFVPLQWKQAIISPTLDQSQSLQSSHRSWKDS